MFTFCSHPIGLIGTGALSHVKSSPFSRSCIQPGALPEANRQLSAVGYFRKGCKSVTLRISCSTLSGSLAQIQPVEAELLLAAIAVGSTTSGL